MQDKGILNKNESFTKNLKHRLAAIINERNISIFIFQTKYQKPLLTHHIPIIRKQGNAFLAKDKILNQRYHYFERGIKRLIIEMELENISFFLVHLSISQKNRKNQLMELAALVKTCSKPVVVGGDFNAFFGIRELNDFLAATQLKSANHLNVFTFPSRTPRWELDFIFHSPEVTINRMEVPRISLSDHLPLICDFTLST